MIHFGIIGMGHIGKRHAQHIMQNKQACLQAVCDIDSKALEPWKERKINSYTSFEEMLEQKEIEVLCICTPNYLHASHAVAAMKAGKHVVVEKPLTLNTSDAEWMKKVAKKENRIVFSVKQNRYNPPVAIAKKWLDKNKLGDVFLVQANCFWNRNDAYYAQSDWRGKKDKDGGCLFTQFSHFVDILYYLMGDLKAVYGVMDNYLHKHNTEFEDTGSFILKTTNGATVNFNFTTCSYNQNMEGSITLMGSKGTLKIGGQYLNTIEYQNIENTEIATIPMQATSNDYGFYKGSMSNHDKVIENVIDVLQNNGTIMTSLDEGKKVVSIIEDMYASAR